MKYLIIIVILILLAGIVYVIKSKQQPAISQLWNTLITNKNPQQEPQHIKAISKWLVQHKGYLTIEGKTTENTTVNLVNYQGDITQISDINLQFFWDNQQFEGKNWIPLDKQNVYEFLRDQ